MSMECHSGGRTDAHAGNHRSGSAGMRKPAVFEHAEGCINETALQPCTADGVDVVASIPGSQTVAMSECMPAPRVAV